MRAIQVEQSVIEKHYSIIEKIGNLGPSPADGYLRAPYSKEETAAMKYIEKYGVSLGLQARWDGVGNLALETPGVFAEWVEVASHIDTVPYGGNFDGAAGVIAGLAAIEAITSKSPALQRGLRLRVWRGEESSTFNSVSSGAKAAFGVLDTAVLQNEYAGTTLEQAMSSQGADSALISSGTATISQAEIDSIAGHFELHIEQGCVLEEGETDIGVVTGIRGPHRLWVFLKGEFDHSGATPMGKKYRRDANLALAHILVRLNVLAESAIEAGYDLVQTAGVINSNPALNTKHAEVYQNAIPKVSGFAYFSLDIRSCDTEFREEYAKQALSIMERVASEFGVQISSELVASTPGLSELSPAMQEVLASSCTKLGLSHTRIPSGAWHDAALIFQQKRSGGEAVPGGMVFIPCRAGKSHCPEEFSSADQIAKGASVLATAMESLAG